MTTWTCNRCNRAYAQERIPSRCACGAQEFRMSQSRYREPLLSVACPYCRFQEELDRFGAFGAEPGNVFCPKCHAEFPLPEPVKFQRMLFQEAQ